MFYLYREPGAKEATVIGADPADGGSDYCSAVAKSKKHADSFMIFNARMESSQFGYELYSMGKFIYTRTGFWPMIGVERNVGMATIHVLQLLNYPRLFRMQDFATKSDREPTKIGWITSSATRGKMLDDYALFLKQKAGKVYDKTTVSQIGTFIRNERTGKPEAAANCKDDLLIAEAIAHQLYQVVPEAGGASLEAYVKQFPDQRIFDDQGNPIV